MYNILVADDSALMRKLMCDIINSVQNFSAKDACADGETAYRNLSEKQYDAVTLNMLMPKASGKEILQRLKKDGNRTPVIAISVENEMLSRTALELGAKDFMVRPFRLSSSDRAVFEKTLTDALHFAVGDGKVTSRTYQPGSGSRSESGNASRAAGRGGIVRTAAPSRDILTSRALKHQNDKGTLSSHTGGSTHVSAPSSGYTGKYSLVAIASSTGGPQALHTLIPMFPKNIGVPMVIVQHMPKGFTASLAERIDAKSKLSVKEAEDGEVLVKNTVYIAPGGRHMQIVNNASGQLVCRVYDDPPVNNLRPCADVMYESLRNVNADHIICAVLTGMGADGSAGIKSLGKVKDLYVITQSEDTCVVYGMPKAADQAGLSNESQPITQISSAITKKLGV